jgi:hypothetical protein
MRALQVKVSALEQENLILKECLRGAQLKQEHSPLSKEVFMCCDGQDNITLRIPTKQTITHNNNFEKECQTLEN